jgi:hypothetical protein
MKKIAVIISIIMLGLTIFAGSSTKVMAATNERMMDDSVFDDSRSMSAGEIQNFLNQFPQSCLKDYTDVFPYDYYNYSGNASAAWIIRRVSDLWGINPRVILAKLEQEENLVTGTSGCALYRYASAVGYSCPSGDLLPALFAGATIDTCVRKFDNILNSYVVDYDSLGFSRQITRGAWFLKMSKERANDNFSWLVPDDASWVYRGKFVNPGYHKRCATCAPIYDDGYFQGVDIQTGATAAFYFYTPFLNQSLDEIYEKWFGSTYSNQCLASSSLPIVSDVTFSKQKRGIDTANLIVYSGTSTNCLEVHSWNGGMQSWQNHVASNQAVLEYPSNQVIYGDLDGGKLDYPILFGVQTTSTSRIESHVWSRSLTSWLAHAASNQAVINPADCKIIIADLDGDQKEDVILVCLRNTASGKIEYQTWNPGMQTWRNKVITNRDCLDPSLNSVVSGDIDGNGADELILVHYNNTGSGKVEFHVWNSGQQTWWYHFATNMPTLIPSDNFSKIEFADINGDGVDEAIYIKQRNTGSGRIEFHVWNRGYTSWASHIASNQPSL